jgi:hypothetical protein
MTDLQREICKPVLKLCIYDPRQKCCPSQNLDSGEPPYLEHFNSHSGELFTRHQTRRLPLNKKFKIKNKNTKVNFLSFTA